MPRKRIGTKSNTALRKKADDAWLLFWQGNDNDGIVFESREEMAAAWNLVRNEWMESEPFCCIKDKFNYGPWGYWEFDCPGAPFTFPDIPGLDYFEAMDYFKRKKLIELRIWPANCYDPLIREAEYVEAAIAAGITSMRFPLYTPEAERRATWKRLLAKRAALVKLGYLKGGK